MLLVSMNTTTNGAIAGSSRLKKMKKNEKGATLTHSKGSRVLFINAQL